MNRIRNRQASIWALLFALLGCVFVYLAVRETRAVYSQRSFEEAKNDIAAMAKWSSTPGHLTKIEVIGDTMRLETLPISYATTVFYEFEVESKDQPSAKKISGQFQLPEYARFGDVKAKLKTFNIDLPEERTEESLELIGFDRKYIYKTSQQVTIYVDPANTSQSTLNSRPVPLTWWQYHGESIGNIAFFAFVAFSLFLIVTRITGIRIPIFDRFYRASLGFGLLGILFLFAGVFIIWNELYLAEFPNLFASIIALLLGSVLAFGGACLVKISFR